MNKKIYAAKNGIIKQKKYYMFLITLMLVGIIAGIIFIFFVDESNKKNIVTKVNDFFIMLKTSKSINYSKSLSNTILLNLLYVLLIWTLGISLIGFPIIIVVLFFRCFVFGLSISSIIYSYGFKGILGSFLYIFPHQIIILILYLLLGFYSLSFCYKLFSLLFLKKTINFNYGMKRYLKILLLSVVISLVISIYEVFISTYFLKLFTSLIK